MELNILKSLTIPAHGVQINTMGLSSMQQKIIDSLSPFIVVSAPTGSGKSFVIINHLLKEKKKKILFIAPTKALVNNLYQSSYNYIKNKYSQEYADDVVKVHNQDASQLYKDIGLNVMKTKVNDIWGNSVSGERIVFSTLESLSYILLNKSKQAHMGHGNILSLLTDFDYIVFDEFHSLDSKSFALAGSMAILGNKLKEEGHTISQFLFLSATSIDLTNYFSGMQIKKDDIEFINESILNKDYNRSIHGNMHLHFIKESPVNILKEVLQIKPNNEKLVLISDSLRNHIEYQMEYKNIWLEYNNSASEEDILFSSSLDNKTKSDINDYPFIIATSTVEMGVNINNLNYLIIEPGFNPASFIQRIGRCCRSDQEGHIYISIPKIPQWLQLLVDYKGDIIDINDLMALLSYESLKIYGVIEGSYSTEINVFDSLNNRVNYNTMLYIFGLISKMQKDTNTVNKIALDKIKSIFFSNQFGQQIYKCIKNISSNDNNQNFIKAFWNEALNLRSFDPGIYVQFGNKIEYMSSIWVQRNMDFYSFVRIGEHQNEPLFLSPYNTKQQALNNKITSFLKKVIYPYNNEGIIEIYQNNINIILNEYIKRLNSIFNRPQYKIITNDVGRLLKITGNIPYANTEITTECTEIF